ncbi:MAG: ABC transporter ATP-binding protein [Gemmatimonadetes bacterium]|nr:ABC transporter ATP-binding protein [Gemmatimonadota bacterium]MYA40898.1 ABC transporter ATP-binding protein [Gemmatimonadota bacterium]MYE91934.1 ABC transporter ATP-binding protein [Gemmatimonadota bacterium]MYJ11621.1 ABC transporter ATP-binding protein [Gemmatimonadota bacterium]
MTVIETAGLTKRFPAVLAVDRVSLTVEQGQVFGFLGPNGSGKTTTIGMLMGIIKPTAGSFRLFGAGAPRDLLAARARVGATLETPNFYPYLSGRDNLRIAAAIKGIGKARIEECLDIVGLSGRGKHRFRTYSLGMKQRLALAATMLNDPELIVLDEPANGLDPKGMKEVRDIIRLLAERGKTIFLSSHLLWEVERTCTHVSIVRKGRVVGTGTVAEIVGGEVTAVVRAEDGERLRAALEAFPEATSVRASDEGLVVALASDDLAALNRYLTGQGIYVSHLARRHRSLEDAFMDLTGEDGDVGQASLTEFAS